MLCCRFVAKQYSHRLSNFNGELGRLFNVRLINGSKSFTEQQINDNFLRVQTGQSTDVKFHHGVQHRSESRLLVTDPKGTFNSFRSSLSSSPHQTKSHANNSILSLFEPKKRTEQNANSFRPSDKSAPSFKLNLIKRTVSASSHKMPNTSNFKPTSTSNKVTSHSPSKRASNAHQKQVVVKSHMSKIQFRREIKSEAMRAKQEETRAEERIQDAEKRLEQNTCSEISMNMMPRPPVVTIMGHVDHGKTTLLDALRQSNVVASEHGGITQHIGAFTVDISSFQKKNHSYASSLVTFLDTPGHAAFTAMRARGTQTTDMVILVIAADDGLQPQTIEAIQHAQASAVPIIVAINKIDMPHRDLSHIYDALASNNVVCETLGGDTQVVAISALKQQNLEGLLEAIQAQAELLELKADPLSKYCSGAVLESKLVKGRGIVATLLVKQGTLSNGDVILSGNTAFAKVKKMMDDRGRVVKNASPSVAVETDGWKSLPLVGDSFVRVTSEDVAKEYLLEWKRERERIECIEEGKIIDAKRHQDALSREKFLQEKQDKKRATLPPLLSEKSTQIPSLSIILKTDVQGSIEAIKGLLLSLNHTYAKEGMENPIHLMCTGVGPITESDVQLASSANALIVGFHVTPADKQVATFARQNGITVRVHRIIYELVDEIQQLLEDRGAPLKIQPVVIGGQAEILQIFPLKMKGKTVFVAGCKVIEGAMLRSASIRIIRNLETVFEGSIHSLKRNKESVEMATKGTECGISLSGNYEEFQVGDIIQCIK